MIDREKVLKGLIHCKEWPGECEVCPYDPEFACRKKLSAEAMELLKETEPVEPKQDEADNSWHCGKCGSWLVRCDNYCQRCGRPVKW